MVSVFDKLDGCSASKVAAGAVIIEEDHSSNCIYVLADGTMEVFRDDVSIAIVSDPGALFGEMSALLEIPHTASVRALTDCDIHVIDNAREFLDANPQIALPIAKLLAERLQHATSYLVDIKRQFADHANHLGMVDEVLEALLNAPAQRFNAPPVEQPARMQREAPEPRQDP